MDELTTRTPVAPPKETGRNIRPDMPAFRLWPCEKTTGYASKRRYKQPYINYNGVSYSGKRMGNDLRSGKL